MDCSEHMKAALRMVSHPDSNEAVFAGLLVLVKYVPPDEFRRQRRLVFDAMDAPTFLNRMLITSGEERSFQRVGLTVLATFCDAVQGEKSLAADLIELFPTLLTLVEDQELMSIEDIAFDILNCMKSLIDASPGLLTNKTNERMLAIMESQKLSDTSIVVLGDLCLSCPVDHLGSLCKIIFNSNEYCQTKLNSLLNDYINSLGDLNGQVQADMSDHIFNLLQQNASESQHQDGIMLANTMCPRAKNVWPFAGSSLARGGSRIVLLARMISIEINVALTKLRYIKETDDTSNEMRTLLDCFSLVGHFVTFILDEEDTSWSSIDFGNVLACQTALSESLQAVTHFFISVKSEKLYCNDQVKMILPSCAKCLCTWLVNGFDGSIGKIESAEMDPRVVSNNQECGGLEILIQIASQYENCIGVVMESINLLMSCDEVVLNNCVIELRPTAMKFLEGLSLAIGKIVVISRNKEVFQSIDICEFLLGIDIEAIFATQPESKFSNEFETILAIVETFQPPNLETEFLYIQLQAGLLFIIHAIEAPSNKTSVYKRIAALLSRANTAMSNEESFHSILVSKLRSVSLEHQQFSPPR